MSIGPTITLERASLYHGDCLTILQDMPENSVDSIVTDPPADIAFMDSAWDRPWEYTISGHGYTDGANRLGTPTIMSSRNPTCRKCRRHRRGWKDVSGCECQTPDFDEADRRLTVARVFIDRMAAIFCECLRVLKPGGFAAVWSLPRTSHWTGMAIELSGFEIQNCIYHVFGQGLPKGLNVALQFEKRLCQRVERKWLYVDTGEEMRRTPPFRDADANRWAGWNTALKPAAECWWLARKPVTESNIAGNVLRWGAGGLNIGACRVGRGSEQFRTEQPRGAHNETDAHNGIGMVSDAWGAADPEIGRWPSNLVFSHSPECRKAGVRRVRNRSGSVPADAPSAPALHTYGEYKRCAFKHHGDADGYETSEVYSGQLSPAEVEWCTCEK